MPDLPAITPERLAQAEQLVQDGSILALAELHPLLFQAAADKASPLSNRVAIAEFFYKMSRLAQRQAVEVAKASRPITSIVYPDGSIVAIGGSEVQTVPGQSPLGKEVIDVATAGKPDAEMEAAVASLPPPPSWMQETAPPAADAFAFLDFDDDLA